LYVGTTTITLDSFIALCFSGDPLASRSNKVAARTSA
jgi:hypothetical protein